MRFHELGIETQRQAPSNARTEGFAFLVRAGYLKREDRPTLLGEKALARLHASSQSAPEMFFEKLKLPVVQTEGEVFYTISTGDIEVLQCPACHYAARRENALFKKKALPAEPVLPMEKVPTPECSTIESLADFLGIRKEKTAKALMYTRIPDGQFIFVAVRGDMQLSEAKLKKLIGNVRPATLEEMSKCGAVAGYASPLGLKDALIVVDDLIPGSTNLVAGANEAGYHLKNTNYQRDYTANMVADVVMANIGDGCPECGTALIAHYAELLLDETGFHYQNILSSLAETFHDDKGLILPVPASPFDVYLMQVPGKEMDTRAQAEEIYKNLQEAGIPVLFDDRTERAGVKFNDADLIGCPLRLTVGEKNLKEGMVELKPRTGAENRLVPIADIVNTIQSLLKSLI